MHVYLSSDVDDAMVTGENVPTPGYLWPQAGYPLCFGERFLSNQDGGS